MTPDPHPIASIWLGLDCAQTVVVVWITNTSESHTAPETSTVSNSTTWIVARMPYLESTPRRRIRTAHWGYGKKRSITVWSSKGHDNISISWQYFYLPSWECSLHQKTEDLLCMFIYFSLTFNNTYHRDGKKTNYRHRKPSRRHFELVVWRWNEYEMKSTPYYGLHLSVTWAAKYNLYAQESRTNPT